MFTLECAGKPLAVTDAAEDQARELFLSEEFTADLRELTSDGAPLWDGEAALVVRRATEQEIEEFDDAEWEDDADLEEGEETFNVVYLVEVDEGDEGEE